jgi:hypothetical protein
VVRSSEPTQRILAVITFGLCQISQQLCIRLYQRLRQYFGCIVWVLEIVHFEDCVEVDLTCNKVHANKHRTIFLAIVASYL